MIVGVVHVQALLEEKADHGDIVAPDSRMQQAAAIVIADVQVRAGRE
jgi:hypothetical protein